MSWPLRAVAISGSPRTPSKSKTLAELLLQALEKGNCTSELIDVAELPAEALVARAQSPAIDAAIEAIGRARIVVAATPTYRALYTGVLKSLFDLMPPGHLRGKICIPIQTGASMAHFLSIEYGLRPLFTSLEGVPIAGVYATDDQFDDGKPAEALVRRINDVAMAARALGTITFG
ncbi:MAG: NAD(P)H-dependent oxidoreductase [Dehalococcoidia bacterium]